MGERLESRLELAIAEEPLLISLYKGIKQDIRICLPSEATVHVVNGLDLLKSGAPDHYRLVEDYVRQIRLSDENYNHATIDKPVIHLSAGTLRRGRVHCAILAVHEARHRELSSEGILLPWEQEEPCLETEADCIEALGERCWREMRVGFAYSRKAYLALRHFNTFS